jgi:hypothetical protein
LCLQGIDNAMKLDDAPAAGKAKKAGRGKR